jgi:DNA-binding ferritin-like protein
MDDLLLTHSLQDLNEDLELFASLTATETSRLRTFHALLTSRSSPFPKETRETLLQTLPSLMEQYQTISRTLRESLRATNTKDEKTF